jgi:hypothetical protein
MSPERDTIKHFPSGKQQRNITISDHECNPSPEIWLGKEDQQNERMVVSIIDQRRYNQEILQ